jgi:aldehyde decarbonylase
MPNQLIHHPSVCFFAPATNHPLLESLFYNALFGVPVMASFAAGCGSLAVAYIYVLFIDFMDAWGHCNFEFIPAKLFRMFPPLKYIVYSPT